MEVWLCHVGDMIHPNRDATRLICLTIFLLVISSELLQRPIRAWCGQEHNRKLRCPHPNGMNPNYAKENKLLHSDEVLLNAYLIFLALYYFSFGVFTESVLFIYAHAQSKLINIYCMYTKYMNW